MCLSIIINDTIVTYTGQKNNPERLSFIERLQLHEKAVKEESEAAKKLPINRSSSATTVNTNASSLRALQKKFAASSDNLDGEAAVFSFAHCGDVSLYRCGSTIFETVER